MCIIGAVTEPVIAAPQTMLCQLRLYRIGHKLNSTVSVKDQSRGWSTFIDDAPQQGEHVIDRSIATKRPPQNTTRIDIHDRDQVLVLLTDFDIREICHPLLITFTRGRRAKTKVFTVLLKPPEPGRSSCDRNNAPLEAVFPHKTGYTLLSHVDPSLFKTAMYSSGWRRRGKSQSQSADDA